MFASLLCGAALFAADVPKGDKIKTAEPKVAAEDPDFAIQGEYEGEAGKKIGLQVVALGGGKFDLKMLRGGLPGNGWDGKGVTKGSAERVDQAVKFSGGLDGKIADGKAIIAIEGTEVTLAKVVRKSATLGAKPPEGAVVLFGGPDDVAKWDNGKVMKLSDGEFLAASGTRTKEKFGAFTAHVEFRLAYMPEFRGQGRSNSGFYMQDRYETQVLDSFGLSGENNECGGIYQQFKPLVNMCFPPMTWQTYDIEFTPAVFEGDKRVKPATATIKHNGVTIHDAIELKGPNGGNGLKENAMPGPFQIQNHGDPVVFRNIWAVEKK